MVKKTLLSLAVATALVSITGCNVSTTDRHENKIVANNPPVATMPEVSNFYPHFAPENQDVPVATDLIFAAASDSDGTANTTVTEKTYPVTTAVNKLAGFSTNAPIYIKFSDEIDPASLVVGGVLPQVYLIQLHNTETLSVPVDSLDLTDIVKQATIAESPTGPIAGALAYGVDFEADAVDLGSGKKDTLRILLKKPLEPKTKYIVALTDGITSVDGEASSGSSTFVLASGNAKLPSAALEPVRTAVQGWSEIAGGAIAQGTSGALTQENLILTYAFTTDGSLDDIKQYAAPGLFVKNNLTVAQAEAMTDKAAGTEDAVAKGMVAAMSGLGITTVELAKAHSAYPVQLFGAIAKADLGGATLTEAAAAPAPRAVELVRPAAVDAALAGNQITTGASPATLLTMAGGSSTDLTTRYIQGSIQLPDFLGAATKTDMGLAAQNPQAAVAQAWRADHNWEANTNVGTILNGALEKPDAFPPKDVDGVSTNVTYRYPFPQQIGTNTAPFLLTLPSKADCSGKPGMNANGEFQTVIFVHGITSNRTASAVYAAQLAAQCIATIAIDLPLHGVAPADGALTMLSMSTADAAATSSPWAAVSAGAMSDPAMGGVAPIAEVSERHGNIWQNENSMRVDMDYTAAKGDSGSAFINLQNFGRTHDNLRQAVTDLLNLNASLVKINEALAADTELAGASANRGTLDLNNVFVAGHSLGGIVASAFVAANNDPEVQAFVGYNPNGGGAGIATGVLPKIQGLIIASSGGQLTKLLENSPAFAPAIVGGLAANGTMQGTEDFEKFLYVFQSKLDGIDPVNTAKQLGDTPVQMFTIIGDGVGAPLNPQAGDALPDTTVPVRDYFADAATNPFAGLVVPACFENSEAPGCDAVGVIALPNAGVPTAKSYLAGTQAIKAAEALNLQSNFVEITLNTGTHSSFAKPDVPAAFGQMAAQSATFIDTNAN